MTPDQIKMFTQDLRRLLYIAKVLDFEAGIMISGIAPHYIKDGCKGLQNAIKRLFNDCMCKHPESWQEVKADLSRDELLDINRIFDSIMDFKNIGDIAATLEEIKFDAIKKHAA